MYSDGVQGLSSPKINPEVRTIKMETLKFNRVAKSVSKTENSIKGESKMRTKLHITGIAITAAAFTLCLFAAQTQAAFIVKPTGAEASSTISGLNRDPVRMIDGSGLSDASLVETDEPVPETWPSHGTQSSGNMWTSDYEVQAQVTYDLGQSYPITDIHLWNSNSADNDTGIKEVDISFSLDGTNFGNTETITFNQGPNASDYTGETYALSTTQDSQYVRFNINTNYGDELSEISETRFVAIPEPGSLLLLGLGSLAILYRRRRN